MKIAGQLLRRLLASPLLRHIPVLPSEQAVSKQLLRQGKASCHRNLDTVEKLIPLVTPHKDCVNLQRREHIWEEALAVSHIHEPWGAVHTRGSATQKGRFIPTTTDTIQTFSSIAVVARANAQGYNAGGVDNGCGGRPRYLCLA